MNVQHTPGPWLYRPEQHDDWGVVRSGRNWICQAKDPRAATERDFAEHRKAGTDPWEANARLIAAAPDLLKALEPFAKASEIRLCGGDHWTDDKSIQGTDISFHITLGHLRAAYAAIAKSTGAA